MSKEDIINYVMTTPGNPNRAVLTGMLDGVDATPDWNENDSKAKGYIANRPFYTDYDYIKTNIKHWWSDNFFNIFGDYTDSIIFEKKASTYNLTKAISTRPHITLATSDAISRLASKRIVGDDQHPEQYPYVWFKITLTGINGREVQIETGELHSIVKELDERHAIFTWSNDVFSYTYALTANDDFTAASESILSMSISTSILPDILINDDNINLIPKKCYVYKMEKKEHIHKIPKEYVSFPDFNIRWIYDNQMTNGLPDPTKIKNPDPQSDTLYVHRISNETGDNVLIEWIWADQRFERFGGIDPVLPKADWEENDSDNINYIQNKPFYYYQPEEILYEADEALTYNAGTNYYNSSIRKLSRGINYGETVTLNIDGIEYSDTVTSDHGYIGAQNPGDSNITTTKVGAQVIKTGPDAVYDSLYILMVSSTERSSGTYHVKLSIKSEPIIKKIDTKFLPETRIINGSADNSIRSSSATVEDADYTMGTNAIALGESNKASGSRSVAIGSFNNATGAQAVAVGYGTTASGIASYSEGNQSEASGKHSHAEGFHSKASGECAHAEGHYTVAAGQYSHAEGSSTNAGVGAHAEGASTKAVGVGTHAEGYYTNATHRAQHVFGRYNQPDPSDLSSTNYGNYVEIVGNGTKEEKRSNARTLDWSGNESLAGSLTLGMGTEDEVTVTAAQLKALIALLNA